MALSLPASREPIADQGLLSTRSWFRYFQDIFNTLTGQTAVSFPVLTVTADNALMLTSQTSDAGTAAGTLTNAPHAGPPAFWLRVQVNGANYAIPLWLA